MRDASKAGLGEVLEEVGTKTLKCLYDFGDGWEHTVKRERLADSLPGIAYPHLIDAAGRPALRYRRFARPRDEFDAPVTGP